MLAEQVIWLGYESKPVSPLEYESEKYNFPYAIKENAKTHETYYQLSYTLKAIGKNRLNIELDKSVRGKIITTGLTPEVINYAGTDVEYLEDIKDSQEIDIKRENLEKAVAFENEFVKVLAYIKFCGVKLDVNKWKAKMAADKAACDSAIEDLNKCVVQYFKEHNGNINNKTILIDRVVESQWLHDSESLSKYGIRLYPHSEQATNFYTKSSGIEQVGTLYIEQIPVNYPYLDQNLQGDLFSGFNSDIYCTLNWGSSKQIIPFFELIGYNLEVFDKKEKKTKKSTKAEVIKKQSDVWPELSNAYVRYKKASKVCDAFGENWLKAINKVTGRIHADFHQIGTITSRLSSGGGEADVNL